MIVNLRKVSCFTWYSSVFLSVFSWEQKIPSVCDGLEKTWLFHEIGWSYLELNRYREARDYGIHSVAAADEIADDKWQINANVLVAQSECNQLSCFLLNTILKLRNLGRILNFFHYLDVTLVAIVQMLMSLCSFISVKLGNFESCVFHFEKALTHAKLQEDDSAMNAIQKVGSLLSYTSLCSIFRSI